MSRGRTLPTRTTATRAEASRACPPTDLARRAAKPGTTSRDWRAGGTSGRRRARPRDAPVSPPPPRATSSSGRSWSSARASPGRRATTRRPRVRPRTKTRPRLLPGAPEAVLRTAAKGTTSTRLPALATATVTEQKSVSCARKRDEKKPNATTTTTTSTFAASASIRYGAKRWNLSRPRPSQTRTPRTVRSAISAANAANANAANSLPAALSTSGARARGGTCTFRAPLCTSRRDVRPI